MTAIAFMVSEVDILNGPVYRVEAAVGAEPSVV
jgi:hypothetical protein